MSRKFLGRSGADFALGLVVGVIIALLVVTAVFTELGDMLQEGTQDVIDTGEKKGEDIVEHRTKYPILQWQNINREDRAGDPPDNSIEIEDCNDLQAMEDDTSEDYVLTNDIDCSETENWNNGGFEPIGGPSNPFTGTFDGQGYEVSDLYIRKPDQWRIGLFGKLENARVENVFLEEADIKGGRDVGGIAGGAEDETEIINCHVNGNITASDNTYSYLGGILGDSENTYIYNSWTDGRVEGEGEYVGGIIGRLEEDVSIYSSFSTASVKGEDNVGGLIGYSEGKVSNTYATGSVKGDEYVGGLIGWQSHESSIHNSYSVGPVQGENSEGLIGGSSTEETVRNSFWNYDTTGIIEDAHDGGGTPKSSELMEAKSTYTDTRTTGLEHPWDFEHTWTFHSGRNYTDEELNTLKMDIQNPQGGYTTPSPGIIYIPKGNETTVRASPNIPDWGFKRWTGDEPGTEKEMEINMDENKEMTAEFTELETVTEVYEDDATIDLEPGIYEIEVQGADGGNIDGDGQKDGDGGEGGHVEGIFSLDQSAKLHICIGQAGKMPGGGSGGCLGQNGAGGKGGTGSLADGGGGGGSTELWLELDNNEDFLAAADGGGGAGHYAEAFDDGFGTAGFGGGGGGRGGDGGIGSGTLHNGDDGSGSAEGYDGRPGGGYGGLGEFKTRPHDYFNGGGGGWEANGDILEDVDGHRGQKGGGDEDDGKVWVTYHYKSTEGCIEEDELCGVEYGVSCCQGLKCDDNQHTNPQTGRCVPADDGGGEESYQWNVWNNNDVDEIDAWWNCSKVCEEVVGTSCSNECSYKEDGTEMCADSGCGFVCVQDSAGHFSDCSDSQDYFDTCTGDVESGNSDEVRCCCEI